MKTQDITFPSGYIPDKCIGRDYHNWDTVRKIDVVYEICMDCGRTYDEVAAVRRLYEDAYAQKAARTLQFMTTEVVGP